MLPDQTDPVLSKPARLVCVQDCNIQLIGHTHSESVLAGTVMSSSSQLC
jgi:hypothetical protein